MTIGIVHIMQLHDKNYVLISYIEMTFLNNIGHVQYHEHMCDNRHIKCQHNNLQKWSAMQQYSREQVEKEFCSKRIKLVNNSLNSIKLWIIKAWYVELKVAAQNISIYIIQHAQLSTLAALALPSRWLHNSHLSSYLGNIMHQVVTTPYVQVGGQIC